MLEEAKKDDDGKDPALNSLPDDETKKLLEKVRQKHLQNNKGASTSASVSRDRSFEEDDQVKEEKDRVRRFRQGPDTDGAMSDKYNC